MSSKLPGWLTGDDDRSLCLSNMGVRVDRGEVDLVTESGGEPDMKATRLNSSVALRLDWWFVKAFRLALDVAIDGSVADARNNLGLLWLLLRVDESRRSIRRVSWDSEVIFCL